MSSLKRRIMKLESDMNYHEKLIRDNKNRLMQKLSDPKIMVFAIMGGVACGFLIEKLQLQKKIGHVIHKVPPVLKGFINFSNIISL